MVTPVLERVDLADLSEYPGNARRGDVEAIRESIRENGVFAPLVVQRSTGHVLSGNHTFRAMLAEGMDQADAYMVDADDERARKIVLAANRTADRASYDDQALADLLQSVDTLEGTGYEESDLDKLLSGLQGAPGAADYLKPGEDAYTEQYGVIVTAASEEEQESIFDRLTELGYTPRVVTV